MLSNSNLMQRLFPFWIIVCSMIIACGDDPFSHAVTIDIPEHESLLSVACHLTEGDSLVKVLVSKSLGIVDDQEYPLISNAVVTIFFNNEVLFEPTFNAGSGYYEQKMTDPTEIEHGLYRLEISAPGEATVWSEQRVGEAVKIESASFERDGTISEEGKAHLAKVSIKDEAGENYYSFNFFYAITFQELSELAPVGFMSQDPSIEYGVREELLLSDGTFDGKSYTSRFYSTFYPTFSDDVKVNEFVAEVKSLTPNHYYYERSRSLYNESQDFPLTEPVIVHDNIENGYGIFTVARRTRLAIKL